MAICRLPLVLVRKMDAIIIARSECKIHSSTDIVNGQMGEEKNKVGGREKKF